VEDLALSQYEHAIASEVIAPEDIRVSFSGMLCPLRYATYSFLRAANTWRVTQMSACRAFKLIKLCLE
jgi:hypothetical protein